MFGTFSNWLNNLQIPLPAFKANEGNEEAKTENAENTAAKQDVAATAAAANESVSENNNQEKNDVDKIEVEPAKQQDEKVEDANDLTKILNIDKQKALDTAKEIGSLFISFGKTATKQLQETATHLKDVIEKNTIIGDFSKENEKFVNEKKVQQRREDAAVAPWIGYLEEDKLKEQILSLSTDSRNFLRNPPAGVEFHFDFNQSYPVALATLEEDPNLKEMRFKLVPQKITEELFWRNYFYRVSLIKQSETLSQLANEKDANESKTNADSDNAKKTEKVSSKAEAILDVTANDQTTLHNNEFVSDSYETSINEEEIKREMKQLKLNNNKTNNDEIEDQDWDKELQDDIDNITAEELEKEISQMIGGDVTTTTK